MASTMSSPMARKKTSKTGWLRKQGGMVRSWHRRWFVLNGDILFYFSKEDDAKPLGTIYLPGNRIIEHSFRPDEPDKFLFEILPGKGQSRMTPGHESYMISASSEDERKDWIKHIRRVMFREVGGAIFGQNIQETMKYEKKVYPGRMIPFIIEECVEFLTKYGLEIEGIFRLPGRTSLIRELKESFDCGERLKLDPECHDVHTVCSLLKLYLRELPHSIIPPDFYQKIMNIALRAQKQEERDHIEELRSQLEMLPEDNYNTLKYMCQFIQLVGQNDDKNKMGEMNLATVFGPNIIRHMDDNPELFMLTADLTHQLAYLLIHNHEQIFTLVPKSDKPVCVPVDDLLGLGTGDPGPTDIPLLPSSDILRAVTDELGIKFGHQSNDSYSSPNPGLASGHAGIGCIKQSRSFDNCSPTPKRPIRRNQVKSLTLPARPIPPLRKSKKKKNVEIFPRSESEGVDICSLRSISPDTPSSPDTPDKWFDPPESPKSWNGPVRNRGHVVYSEDQFSGVVVTSNNNDTLQFSETEVLQQQNDVLKETLSRTKSKFESQQKSLTDDRENMKKEYEVFIAGLQERHKTHLQELEDKLEAEQKHGMNNSRSVVNSDKVRPSIPQIHLLNASLKDELSRTKSTYETQVTALKTELRKMKENNTSYIERLEQNHKTHQRDLEARLGAEKTGRAEAVARIMSLQAQLHEYQMKFGEMTN